MKKKGFELSINFLVALIITVIVFSFALVFAYKFFGESKEMQAKIDQRTQAELQTLIASQGMRVAIYPTQIETTRGKQETLGVGILNVLAGTKIFNVRMDCTKYINTSNVGSACPSTSIKSAIQQEIEIKQNKDGVVGAVIITDSSAKAGTYIFDINVSESGKNYGGLQKVYVKL